MDIFARLIAKIIGVQNEDDLDSLLLAHNPRFVQLLEEARQRVRVTGGVSLADFRQHLEGKLGIDN